MLIFRYSNVKLEKNYRNVLLRHGLALFLLRLSIFLVIVGREDLALTSIQNPRRVTLVLDRIPWISGFLEK